MRGDRSVQACTHTAGSRAQKHLAFSLALPSPPRQGSYPFIYKPTNEQVASQASSCLPACLLQRRSAETIRDTRAQPPLPSFPIHAPSSLLLTPGVPVGAPPAIVPMVVGAMEAASSPAAFDGSGGTSTTIEDLPADVLALVLRRLDGASLAAVGCASSGLHGLATDPDTWRALCLAMWPSVRDLLACVDDHRALFADAFPFPCSPDSPSPAPPPPLPARLVSAVDLRHAGVSILSRVVETDAASDWFLGAPFRVDALVQEGLTSPPSSSAVASGSPSASAISPADLELSWVLLDPATGRAINASSRRAVAVDRKWLTGDTVARFAVVLDGTGASGGGLALDAAVTCDERYGHVREVSLRVEDADGTGVSGRDGLAAVANAMAAPRRRGAAAAEDAARERYGEFVRGKRARKERKARREGILDLCCSGVGAAAFLGFLVMLAFR